ncbi:MAG: Dam family site-specific DNA-(adenine-N6)-methyltransferase [Nitrososphaeraceae archaeon]|nr:Dam family site-specific DNA-(adenine-N6)-methyltransferase [Nitrososphaeraceae archaeon]
MDQRLPQTFPFVKWAGGKTQLLDRIDKLVPKAFDRYFEPFLGGGALFYHLAMNRQFIAYLSDINQELINVYEVVKSNVEGLIDVLRVFKEEYYKAPEIFYRELRDEFDTENRSRVEKAAKLITLNKTCYNGLYRVNSHGKFNVPMGRYKNPIIYDSKNLRNASLILGSLESHLYWEDYQKILADKAQEGDFVYLDPPYNPMTSTANFTGYTGTGFTKKDQECLAKIFKELDTRGCKILLSNSDTEYVKELYADYAKNILQVTVRRNINSRASKRLGHMELLIRNYSN